eukprot:CAMPEP_0172492138 /NCGR_PEP_ID=MMETSP1066-20121228/23173_1 /TAXON_ID=671091 /ORGANISM="Coscinodiscus wailesii, Strain CCMP2513" /LENGTH=168 /DNA_ID=CAMNT_0013261589 /DNA_START=45 /DNA_END=548 /DNA_ORIENTATION=+
MIKTTSIFRFALALLSMQNSLFPALSQLRQRDTSSNLVGRMVETVSDYGADEVFRVISSPVMSLGSGHTCGIEMGGDLMCWGYNDDGRIGDGTTVTRRHQHTKIDLGAGRAAVHVSLGGSHSCAIRDDGALMCWGWNDHGQIGDGTTVARHLPTKIDLGAGRAAVHVS